VARKNDKVKRAYQFFCDAEQHNRIFTLQDIADVAEWSLKTTQAYRSKKWYFFIEEVDDGLICKGIYNTITEDAFIRLHSQRASLEPDILRPRFSPEVDTLIDKARESAMLGVQLYNNPLASFRTPGYIVHMIIAYTALFHAIFERRGTEYWYKNDDGTPKIVDGDKRAWELRQCLKAYYGGHQSAVAANLEFFIDIRNKIEHRFVPALDTTLSGRCQALLMNFEELLVNEFGGFFALGQNLALALQFSVFSKQQQEALRRVQAKEYEAITEYIQQYDAKLPDDITESMQYSFRAFLIPKLGNHAKSSDVAIEYVKFDPDNPEDMEEYKKQIAFIREKRVQVANQGKLKPRKVVALVQERTNTGFNMDHHTKAWKLYAVRTKDRSPNGCDIRYCQYDEAHRDFVYTPEWVEFLCKKVSDPDEFERIKRHKD
jgi:hypothetical protein